MYWINRKSDHAAKTTIYTSHMCYIQETLCFSGGAASSTYEVTGLALHGCAIFNMSQWNIVQQMENHHDEDWLYFSNVFINIWQYNTDPPEIFQINKVLRYSLRSGGGQICYIFSCYIAGYILCHCLSKKINKSRPEKKQGYAQLHTNTTEPQKRSSHVPLNLSAPTHDLSTWLSLFGLGCPECTQTDPLVPQHREQWLKPDRHNQALL